MSIDKQTLYNKVEETLKKQKEKLKCEYTFLMNLIEKVIFNDCTKNSIFK